jgi:hypothetical protein
MNFGGHQFTGFFGVDCYKERFKISAMYGRLLETVGTTATSQLLLHLQRFGYGLNIICFRKVNIGVHFFETKTRINSINHYFHLIRLLQENTA